jgi:hypothetical protein
MKEINIKKILIILAMSFLIFDNIPKFMQMNTLSGSMSNKLSWYPLFILLLVVLFDIKNKRINLSLKDKYMVKYLVVLLGIFYISNIQGLLVFPYYQQLLDGSQDQIEKLSQLLYFLGKNHISYSLQDIIMGWIGSRTIKNTLLEVTYTFGFTFVIYLVIRENYKFYLGALKKCVILSIALLSLYSLVELGYLAGNPYAKAMLKLINPWLHPIMTNHGWWPPLLWNGQLRSMFSEPSRMGNYAGFALPIMWFEIIKGKKYISFSIILTTFYTFLIFMTKARTPVAIYWGLLILTIISLLFFTGLKYWKSILLISGISALSLITTIGFTNLFMPQENITVSNYVNKNIGSLTKEHARSNGARYALIRSNIKTGIDHPLFGVGDQLNSAYTVSNFNEEDLNNKEVQLWVQNYYENGILKYNLNAMNAYVTLFANHGILGLIAYIFPLAFILKKLYDKMTFQSDNQKLDSLAITLSLIGSAVAGCNGSLTLLYTYWIILAYAFASVYKISYNQNEPT